MLLASTVRFLAGSVAGLCTLLIVLGFSMVMDQRPLLFFLLSLCLWILMRIESRHRLLLINAVPVISLAVLVFTGLSVVPVVGLFLANAITLISLAYRGWASKRLLD